MHAWNTRFHFWWLLYTRRLTIMRGSSRTIFQAKLVSSLDSSLFDSFAQAVSDADPCGADLEYDPLYLEMERLVQGKAEAQFGKTLIEAEPPDWKEVRRLCLGLFERTRDLRIAVQLARAELALNGIAGFSGILRLIDWLLMQRWETLHPRLDADDDNDPTLRVNTLATLVDPTSVVLDVLAAPFIRVPGASLSLRDIDMATGEVPVPEGQDAPTMAAIENMLAQIELDLLAAAVEQLDTACVCIAHIESGVTERVGAGQSLSMAALAKPMQRARDFAALRLRQRGGPATDSGDQAEAGEAGEAGGQGAGSAAQVRPGEISGRDDVIREIDRLCAYYDRYEPTSPVPLLLQRARRQVSMSFLDLLQDMAPEGLAQARLIGGVQSE